MDSMQCFFKHTNSYFVLVLLFMADSKLPLPPIVEQVRDRWTKSIVIAVQF